tara:strand:- start:1072 stop:1530 length:459 start_codon:yes stop_codon:yes gene_type:complete
MIIRDLELSDYHQCFDIGKGFQENSVFSIAGWDDDKYNNLIIQGSDAESDTFACVADLEGTIVGIFFGYVTEYYFSKKLLAQDLIVLFLPDYRSYAYEGLEIMLNKFESWAKEKGAIEICIGSSTNQVSENYKQFLESNGYNDVGFITKKRI